MLKTIKMNKEQKRFLNQFVENTSIAIVGIVVFTKKYKDAQESLWEKIREIFPDIPEDEMARPTFDHPKTGDWLITYQDKQ